MNFNDALKWVKLGFKIRRKRWPCMIYCESILEDVDGRLKMKLNKPTVPFQTVTKIERNANDWEKL